MIDVQQCLFNHAVRGSDYRDVRGRMDGAVTHARPK